MQIIIVKSCILVNFSSKKILHNIEAQIGVVDDSTFPSLSGRFIITR